jgi:hypothetical protein
MDIVIALQMIHQDIFHIIIEYTDIYNYHTFKHLNQRCYHIADTYIVKLSNESGESKECSESWDLCNKLKDIELDHIFSNVYTMFYFKELKPNAHKLGVFSGYHVIIKFILEEHNCGTYTFGKLKYSDLVEGYYITQKGNKIYIGDWNMELPTELSPYCAEKFDKLKYYFNI